VTLTDSRVTFNFNVNFSYTHHVTHVTQIRYDTIGEFNVDSKAEY